MKNLSLFIPILAIIFTTFTGNITLSASYSQELQDAYQFAYKNGITTMYSIDKADMNGGLTRIAMAKMLSQYAINVLGKTPDKSKTIIFPDVSSKLDNDYNNGVTLAYQLGIMGIGIDKFRPFDSVTRAEFGTALSRVLYGDTYNQNGDNYYSKHLNALKNAGIMTKIDTPFQKEIRGYVMLMLMRSDKSYSQNLNNNKLNHGTLRITTTLSDHKPGGTLYGVNQFTLIPSESIKLNKIVFEKIGSVSNNEIKSINLYHTYDYNNYPLMQAKDTATLDENNIIIFDNLRNEYTSSSFFLGKNNVLTPRKITLMVEFKDSVELGKTIGFKIKEIVTSAENIEYDNIDSLYTIGQLLNTGTTVNNIGNEKDIGEENPENKIQEYQQTINIDIDEINNKENPFIFNKTSYFDIFSFSVNSYPSVNVKDIIIKGSEKSFSNLVNDLVDIEVYINGKKIDSRDFEWRFLGRESFSDGYLYPIKISFLKSEGPIKKVLIKGKFGGNNLNEYILKYSQHQCIEEYQKTGFNSNFTFDNDFLTLVLTKDGTRGKQVINLKKHSDNQFISQLYFVFNVGNVSECNELNNNENTNTQPDNTSPNNTAQNDENSNNSNDEHSNESNNSESSSNSTSNSNCVDIEVDDKNSYNFCIVKGKSNGSKYSIKVDNAKDLSLCTVGKGGQNYDFYDCEGDITSMGSSGISQLRLSIKYNNKTYSKKIDYDLTNGVFVNN